MIVPMPEVLILGIICILSLLLYLRERHLRNQLLQKPLFDFEENSKKGLSLLHSSMKKAQALLGMAELESVKLVSDSKQRAGKLEQQYELELLETVKQSKTAVTEVVTQTQQSIVYSQQQFEQFLHGMRIQLETSLKQSQLVSQEHTKQQISHLFESFEQNLSTFLTQTETESVKAIELELKAARRLIDTYKTQQLALIDENIIAMLEKTLSIVLSKKLTLKDQLELVYDALEKAKVEKFIV